MKLHKEKLHNLCSSRDIGEKIVACSTCGRNKKYKYNFGR